MVNRVECSTKKILHIFLSLIGLLQLSLCHAQSSPQAPILHSLLGAPVTIYLDFDGHLQSIWGQYSNIVSEPFDIDGDTNTFSVDELDSIRWAWVRVAESFSIFNIDVTTELPADTSAGHMLRVVISKNTWFPVEVGGVTNEVGAFLVQGQNIVYVFPNSIFPNSQSKGIEIGLSAIHESGHAFGLWHQAEFNSNGQFINEYRSSNEVAGYFMGFLTGSTLPARMLWTYGLSGFIPGIGTGQIQDDIQTITRPQNNITLRSDDHGDRYSDASAFLSYNEGTRFQQNGIITSPSDSDYFKFTTEGGMYSLILAAGMNFPDSNITVPAPMLHAVIDLKDSSGNLVTTFDAGAALLYINTLQLLPAGTYYLNVRSAGEYEDRGQYSIQICDEATIKIKTESFSYSNDSLVYSGAKAVGSLWRSSFGPKIVSFRSFGKKIASLKASMSLIGEKLIVKVKMGTKRSTIQLPSSAIIMTVNEGSNRGLHIIDGVTIKSLIPKAKNKYSLVVDGQLLPTCRNS